MPDPWFPCYPSKFLGALAGMGPDDGYLYMIVCLRIYEVGGRCADSADALARRSGLTRRRVSAALDRLVSTGKLIREPAGLMNPFCSSVLNERQLSHEKAIRDGTEKTVKNQRNGSANHRRTHTPSPSTTTSTFKDLGSDSKVGIARAVRIVRMPLSPDWSLSVSGFDAALKAGMTEPDIIAMAGRFKQHYLASGMRMADWHAKWMGWVFEEVERPKRSVGGKRKTFMDVVRGG